MFDFLYRCSYYLGYEEEQLVGRSWYDFIAPDFLGLAAKHHIAGRAHINYTISTTFKVGQFVETFFG